LTLIVKLLSDETLLALHLNQPVLDGVAHVETVNRDSLLLTDAIDAVDGLLFESGVPPGIEDDDVVGVAEIKTDTTCCDGDKQNVGVGVFELVEDSLLGIGVETTIVLKVVVSERLEVATENVEGVLPLREDEDFVIVGLVVKNLCDFGEFGGGGRRVAVNVDLILFL
jgi:hypothetical protein